MIIRLVVFIPKSIDKASFYLDYPLVKKSMIIFVSNEEDLQKVNGITRVSSYIVYAGLPFSNCRGFIQHLKANGLKVFNYETDTMYISNSLPIGDDSYAKLEREYNKLFTESI